MKLSGTVTETIAVRTSRLEKRTLGAECAGLIKLRDCIVCPSGNTSVAFTDKSENPESAKVSSLLPTQRPLLMLCLKRGPACPQKHSESQIYLKNGGSGPGEGLSCSCACHTSSKEEDHSSDRQNPRKFPMAVGSHVQFHAQNAGMRSSEQAGRYTS